MGKKGSKKTAKKAYKQSATYLKKGAKKTKGKQVGVMDEERDTVEIMGKRFLKCQQEDCEWNVGWLGGLEWTEYRDV